MKHTKVAEELATMDASLNVHQRLMKARAKFHALKLKKSGKNSFAGYEYFELGDFLVPGLQAFHDVGLCAHISFDAELATMTITNVACPDDYLLITSPMGSAALKGCHEVQNIGAVETYQRRYLWVAALEIVEHDALDSTTGKAEPAKVNGRISIDQFNELQTLLAKSGVAAERFCKRFEVEAVAELPIAKFDEAKAALENKIKEPA